MITLGCFGVPPFQETPTSIHNSQTLEPLMGVFFSTKALTKGSLLEKKISQQLRHHVNAQGVANQFVTSHLIADAVADLQTRLKLLGDWNSTKQKLMSLNLWTPAVTSSYPSELNMKAELATAELRSQRWCSVTVSGKLKFSGKPCKRRSSRLVKYLNTLNTMIMSERVWKLTFLVFWSHIRQNCSWALKFGRSKTNFCPASHLLQASQVVALDHLTMHEAAHPQDHLAKTGSSYLTGWVF